MARYWPGRSLLELYRGDMSWRELKVFLRHLPRDSATHRSVHPQSPDEEFWTPERDLAAAAVDAIRETTYAAIKLHGDRKKTRRLKPPKRIPRPGVEDQPDPKVIRLGGRRPSSAKELAAAFSGAAATE